MGCWSWIGPVVGWGLGGLLAVLLVIQIAMIGLGAFYLRARGYGYWTALGIAIFTVINGVMPAPPSEPEGGGP